MRGRAMSLQTSAEPTIDPTRPARSRTTSTLSPGAATAVLASSMLAATIILEGAIVNSDKKLWPVDRRCHVPFRSSKRLLRGLLLPFHELLKQLLRLLIGHGRGVVRSSNGLRFPDIAVQDGNAVRDGNPVAIRDRNP